MTSRRLLKAAEAIREVVSMAILTEIRDPRVQNVTVTGVEVAPDMKSAKVAISVMGDEGRQHLCLRGLQNASGFLQSRIADRIDTRYTPRLTFSLDTGLKKSQEVNRILAELARERGEQGDQDPNAELPDSPQSHATGVAHDSSSLSAGTPTDAALDPTAATSHPKPPPASANGADASDDQS